MKNTIKHIAFALVIAFTFVNTSCMPEANLPEERTLALELSEIKEVIEQIEDAGLNVDTSDLGIYYIIDTLGAEPFPHFGDTLYMKYTGYFLDGYIFDASEFYSNNVNGIWEFIYQPDDLIKGFEDGISLMSKGTRLNMIIPSSLAYGAGGTRTILPYTPLRFEAEMINIKPAN